jgi:7-cyano-7-deazaguanine synthase in queuosine biosynthesis
MVWWNKKRFIGRVIFIRSADYPDLARVTLYDPETKQSYYADCNPEVLEQVGLVPDQQFTFEADLDLGEAEFIPIPFKKLTKEEIAEIRKEVEDSLGNLDLGD